MSNSAETHQRGSLFSRHHILEKNPILLVLGILIMVSIGGLVEIVPLFYLKSTIETVQGMRPYTPLELAGRNIYVREGCYLCHSQMIRALRDEVERYGHYSLAAESMYDHPFQWGSKRNGPDIARVGGKVYRRLACRPSHRPALGRAAVDHAELRLPDDDPAGHARTGRRCRDEPRGRRSVYGRHDGERDGGSESSGQPGYARGGGATRSATRRLSCASSIPRLPKSPKATPLLRICKCLARSSISSCTTTRPICADRDRGPQCRPLTNGWRSSRNRPAPCTASCFSSRRSFTRFGRRTGRSSMTRPACRCGRIER